MVTVIADDGAEEILVSDKPLTVKQWMKKAIKKFGQCAAKYTYEV
jgi:hypothetical protein